MKRFGKLALLAGLALVALGVIQARRGNAHVHDEGALTRVSAVANGVLDRVLDWLDRLWGDDEGEARVAQVSDGDFAWSGRIDTGDAIEIKGVNGDVIAQVSDGREVEVTATKRARRSDPDEVRIEVVEHRDGVTICAVYPGRDNSCEPGDGGRNHVKNNDVQVTFHVRVPEGVTFVGRTINGDVQADDLRSDIEAGTVNGGLDLSTTGSVRAETVNGSIRADFESHEWAGSLEFSTVNGSITLDVPDDLDADLEASWVNGGLDSDLPFTASGRMSRRHAEGRLGRGGPEIELSTVNGSIRIR